MKNSNLVSAICLIAIASIATFSQKTPHQVAKQQFQEVAPASYEIYSVLLTKKYGFWFKKGTPILIARFTEPPDHAHGNLMRCNVDARTDADRDLVKQFLSDQNAKHRIESKLKVPGPYTIIEGKATIKEGKDPGLIWLSDVQFSQDGKRAVVWMRNFCGGLCGSGLLWKLDKTKAGWKVDESFPGCGFIS